MSRYRPILVGCPQYRVFVRGSYECDENGQYILAADGSFALSRARCGHYGGRCMQTLCALHRYNRRGKGSWFPQTILARMEKAGAPCPTPDTPEEAAPDSTISIKV